MTVFLLLEVSFIMKVVSVLFILSAVALVLIILIQKGRGGGLSSAFGGGGAGGLLGSKTGDFLTWVTIGFVGAFLLLAVLMAKYYRPSVVDVSAPGMVPPPQGQPQSQPGSAPQPGPDAGESVGTPEVPVAPGSESSEDTADEVNSAAPTGN
jgi:preprotein translocase subunit SecG